MRKMRDIECLHENCVKVRNNYVCVKCNRKFSKEQLEKIRRKYDT